jgi:uncharacterized membrane-anchored protein
MPSDLLTDNQARHLTAVLGLLLDDLAELGADLPHEPWAQAAAAQIRDAAASVRGLLAALHLRLPERARPRRRLQAYAGIWLARLHDLRAQQLSGYGAVADGLEAALNPRLDEISTTLERLARLAQEGKAP